MGILSDAAAGELQEGDLILEIDGYNVRGATLEEATEALLESLSEMAELHVEDGEYFGKDPLLLTRLSSILYDL
ncbi:unnamed protein product [Cylicostephanus goldi]|uniref:PDZ domain-containing protein n=1 Tax=Cylicostephanus goldi TaxID=71465 RepID=A0A3P7R451_CYLGO|nr:unnamed protein product [Cylicostephanus goldi]